MKKSISILVLLFVLSYSGSCQFFLDEFEDEFGKAEHLYSQGKYLESAIKYKSALAIIDNKYPLSGYYYNAAIALIKAGHDNRQVFNYLENWVKTSWVDSTQFFNNPKFHELHDQPEWDRLTKYVHERTRIYLNVQGQLIKIGKLDQNLRLEAVDIQEKYGKTSDEYKRHWQAIQYQDSLNLIDVEFILSQYGWLDKSKVGSKASNTLWKVIHHASDKVRQKYLPLIQESVSKGETPASKLAILHDRILINQGKKQIFGSQFFTDEDTDKIRVFPIHNPDQVNVRRNNIGMSDIETYLKFCGIDTITENTFSDSLAMKILNTYIK